MLFEVVNATRRRRTLLWDQLRTEHLGTLDDRANRNATAVRAKLQKAYEETVRRKRLQGNEQEAFTLSGRGAHLAAGMPKEALVLR
jgi:hypothetical protein